MTVFEKDLYRYVGSDAFKLKSKIFRVLFTPGITYTFFFRRASNAKFAFMRFIWLTLLHITKIITGIQIPAGTCIGSGMRILHFGTIIINPEAIIGKNFNISTGTVIGRSSGKRGGVPIIGDNVCVMINAMVVGNCRIGNDVLIAPGAFVNFDVPDNSIVIGNPGKIIARESSPTKKEIVYPIPEDTTGE